MWGSVSTACNSRRRLSMPKPHVQNTSWISAEHKGSCCTYAATWGTTEVLPIFHILVQISTLPFTCQHKECGFLLREGNLKCYHCIRKLRGSHILLDGNDFQSLKKYQVTQSIKTFSIVFNLHIHRWLWVIKSLHLFENKTRRRNIDTSLFRWRVSHLVEIHNFNDGKE